MSINEIDISNYYQYNEYDTVRNDYFSSSYCDASYNYCTWELSVYNNGILTVWDHRIGGKQNININDNNLDEVLFEHIEKLNISMLKDDIEDNEISKVNLEIENFNFKVPPKQLCNTNIGILNLSNNKLTNIDILTLLPYLRVLLVCNNELTEIPILKELVSLNCDNNKIKTIGISNKLKHICAVNNELTSISPFTDLFSLNVCENKIKYINFTGNIKILHIGGNPIYHLRVEPNCIVFADYTPLLNMLGYDKELEFHYAMTMDVHKDLTESENPTRKYFDRYNIILFMVKQYSSKDEMKNKNTLLDISLKDTLKRLQIWNKFKDIYSAKKITYFLKKH